MIGQYLSNNNEKRYSAILPKILDLNQPMVLAGTWGTLTIFPFFLPTHRWNLTRPQILPQILLCKKEIPYHIKMPANT
jgi:hypothetical protein